MPLARCTDADIPQICAIEQRAENKGRIGAWPPETHAAHMRAAHVGYFARRAVDGSLAAYAIVDRIIDPDGRAYLRRIATETREQKELTKRSLQVLERIERNLSMGGDVTNFAA